MSVWKRKAAITTWRFCGVEAILSMASVMRLIVPSGPTIRSYPADDFRGRRRVLTTVPSARTTVIEMAYAFIVPYRYAFLPD